MGRISIYSIFFFAFILTVSKLKAQTDDEVKALWVYNIAEYITWPDESKFVKVEIAVYGTSKSIYNTLKTLAKSKKLKNKPVEVTYISQIKLLKNKQIVFINNDALTAASTIYDELKGQNVLIYTDQSIEPKYFMINLLPLHEGKKRFELNKQNITQNGLQIDKALIVQGGTEVDLRGIYAQAEKELGNQKTKLELAKAELIKQENELKRQKEENIKQKEENQHQKEQIARQSKEISQQDNRINSQKLELAKLIKDLESQLEKLKTNTEVLKKQEDKLKIQQAEMEKRNGEITQKTKQIEEADLKIKNQKNSLVQYSQQVEQQRLLLYLAIGFVLLFLSLAFFIYRSLRLKRKANRMLEEKNNAINLQKEELVKQAFELDLLNKELEKLSIVASKTQNAVVIMDSKGNFEWVNAGFTKLYGYTLQLWSNEKDENIVKSSTHPEIDKIIDNCITKKETVIYEALHTARNGKNKWVQTTLTPILDDNKEILKVVAIDSDISKIKEQELEILTKNEELSSQKEELEQQKEQIMFKNNQISSSIKYALTIQKAILPVKQEMDLLFESFIIYKPKDIVSGDFYWFTNIREANKFFIAVVDCTGHGVPGAFMSLIGNRLLNEIVLEKSIYNPAEILNNLDDGIKKALKQTDSLNDDGMDVSLCSFETISNNQYKITYCGAKQPLFYYKNSTENKLESIRATRRSLGGAKLKRHVISFENEEITLSKGDKIYLTSDGLIDQNGPDRKRFGTARFAEVLEEIARSPLQEQKSVIEEKMRAYQQNEDQRDDITILGLCL